MYYGGEGLVLRNIHDCMKEYCTNRDRCRRETLLKHFDNDFIGSPVICVVVVMFVSENVHVGFVLVMS